MRIPKNITRAHILMAIERADKEGWPKKRNSTRFDLLHNNRRFPPKYLISIANKFANGKELSSKAFTGGDESNDFLTNLGFDIRPKNP